jgi:hypothetical protein
MDDNEWMKMKMKTKNLFLGGKDSRPFLPCANMVLTSTRVEAADVHSLIGALVFPKIYGFLTPLEKTPPNTSERIVTTKSVDGLIKSFLQVHRPWV